MGKLSDGHPAPLSDETGHSSQFLWGYVDELAPVVNHTCGDMRVVGLSPPQLSLPNLKIPLYSFITDLEPFSSPVGLPGYIKAHVGESYKCFLPIPHSKARWRLLCFPCDQVQFLGVPHCISLPTGEVRLPLEQVCSLCALSAP